LHLRPTAALRRSALNARGRPPTLAGLGCLLMAVLTVVMGSPAFAHATVVATNPAADRSVARSPAALSLSFNEDVKIGAIPVVLVDSAGDPESLGVAILSQHDTVLRVPVKSRLSGGVYSVTWQVTSADGDAVAGSYRFGVGPSLAGQLAGGGGQQLSNPGMWPTALLRWLLFGAFAIGFGGIAASALARRRSVANQPPTPTPLVLPAAAVGVLAAAGLAALNIGGGDLVRGLTHPTASQLLQGREGVLVAIEVLAFAAAAAAAFLRRPTYAAAPFLVVAIAEGLRGHPDALAGGWGALLVTAHLCALALWVGGLVQVLRTASAWRAERRMVWLLLRDYSRWALWLFLGVLATGVTATIIVTPLTSISSTTYGRVLLVKLALVAGAAVVAYTARRRLASATAVGAVVGRARVESTVLLAVLAVTGLLVSEPPPRVPSGTPLFAPPLRGRSVDVGGLAGQIGVLVQAAQGRVNVTLTAPELGSVDAQQPPGQSQPYRLTGALHTSQGQHQPLIFAGCGTGCFTSPAKLTRGLDQLSLNVQAEGWNGGVIALTLPWPPHPAPRRLADVVAEMRRLPKFTLYEQVTSDTSEGLGPRRRFSLGGTEFVGSEPYSQGRASLIDEYSAPGGTILDLAYPTDGINVQLTVDADNRIVRETLADPNHLVVRSFVYPEGR